MSAGLPVPGKVMAHGFLTKDGMKMGKSLGNVLDPVALTDAYGSDAVRFFFMKEVTFGEVSSLACCMSWNHSGHVITEIF